jgi:hypothetical protein
MFLKIQYIQKVNGGGGVVFATGTPIANSVAEMFTMQRYLQMGTLRKAGVASLRFLGGDVWRTGDGNGTCAGRRRLPAQHALRAVHQCAGVDADVSVRWRTSKPPTR